MTRHTAQSRSEIEADARTRTGTPHYETTKSEVAVHGKSRKATKPWETTHSVPMGADTGTRASPPSRTRSVPGLSAATSWCHLPRRRENSALESEIAPAGAFDRSAAGELERALTPLPSPAVQRRQSPLLSISDANPVCASPRGLLCRFSSPGPLTSPVEVIETRWPRAGTGEAVLG